MLMVAASSFFHDAFEEIVLSRDRCFGHRIYLKRPEFNSHLLVAYPTNAGSVSQAHATPAVRSLAALL